MRVAETNVYKFSELSDSAKGNAREWMRRAESSYFDPDSAYEDLQAIASIMGIEIAQRRQNVVRRDGSHSSYMTPCIYWSGFSSQGDGACFEGTYSYASKASKKIREYAPNDEALHRIADRLQAVQMRFFYSLYATVVHRGHYYHEMSTSIYVSDRRGFDMPEIDTVSEEVSDCLRDFMRWIYKRLESEYEYRMSDEAIDETIEANEYEFDESGNVWR